MIVPQKQEYEDSLEGFKARRAENRDLLYAVSQLRGYVQWVRLTEPERLRRYLGRDWLYSEPNTTAQHEYNELLFANLFRDIARECVDQGKPFTTRVSEMDIYTLATSQNMC